MDKISASITREGERNMDTLIKLQAYVNCFHLLTEFRDRLFKEMENNDSNTFKS